MQIGVITNPNSRKNKTRPHRAYTLQSIVGQHGEVFETKSPESIKPVLREFLRRKARYWVSDGGDGALHWMLRMYLEVMDEAEFAGTAVSLPVAVPTRSGTIDFVANNVGIQGDAESILVALRRAVEQERELEEIEVDSMLIEGVQVTADGDVPFRTLGFAAAAGGVGQRFFAKYYEDADPNPRTIMKVIANTVASMPVALSPLRFLPGMPRQLREYARDVFKPTQCRVTVDGEVAATAETTSVHIASMSINLGNVLKFFGAAEAPGVLSAIVGSPTPWVIFRNLPRMAAGKAMQGPKLMDRACAEMTMEAVGDELLEPVIDGEYYRDLRKVTFRVGPRVRIPKVVAHGGRN